MGTSDFGVVVTGSGSGDKVFTRVMFMQVAANYRKVGVRKRGGGSTGTDING